MIASDGPVRSVLLLLRPGLDGPAAVQRVALDPHSRTGRALAAIVLRERWLAEFEAVELPGDLDPFVEGSVAAGQAAGGAVDAVQRIGDPALVTAAAHPQWRALDLGEEWRVLTGLPFVYAGWIGRPGFDPATAAAPLEAAAAAGLARREQLADQTRLPGVGPAFLRRYLGEELRYRLPEDQVAAALAAFGRRIGQPVGR